MYLFTLYILFLGLIYISVCDISLQIIRNTDENYTPLNNIVSEKVGTNLTLSCELLSDDVKNNLVMDDHLIWEKAPPLVSLKSVHNLEQLTGPTKMLYSLVKPSDINKAVKNFLPLRLDDAGVYFCISFKYMLFKGIQVEVESEINNKKSFKIGYNFQMGEECSGKMFQCIMNGVCINEHYVCDGRKDCQDGSDESYEKCNGDPCKDKLPCEDGRCIPHFWCCDRHHDINCNVTYRPACCQQLSDPYEDLEYNNVPYNITQTKPENSRYVFLSFCILATFLSVILMLLIVSKVFIFANKTACTNPRNIFQLEELTIRQNRSDILPFRGNLLGGPYQNRLILSNVRYVDSCNESGNEVSDSLLSTRSPDRNICRTYIQDEPPSYSEVVESQCDPPPPYTSRECLNVLDDKSRTN